MEGRRRERRREEDRIKDERWVGVGRNEGY